MESAGDGGGVDVTHSSVLEFEWDGDDDDNDRIEAEVRAEGTNAWHDCCVASYERTSNHANVAVFSIVFILLRSIQDDFVVDGLEIQQ